MLASLLSATVFGVDACTVHVEVDVSFGFPSFTMVGLPDASVRESRDRVRSAIRNSGFEFPPHRITVNLAPADVRKAGAAFDLPIALGILAAQGVVVRRDISDLVILGELSLDGAVQAARGILPIAAAARRDGLSGALLPRANASEAAIVEGLSLFPVASLGEAVRALNEPGSPTFVSPPPRPTASPTCDHADLADVRGQLLARRALEVACAGGHNLLLVGPPGAGKTMMARRVAGILPPLTFDEALEVTSIHSVAGLLPSGSGLVGRPAVQSTAPHHLERGTGRRRFAATAGRSELVASWGALSGRTARVQPARPRSAAPAARRGSRHDRARGENGGLPCPLRPRRGHEPVPLWLFRRSHTRVPLHTAADLDVSLETFGTATRSPRSHR